MKKVMMLICLCGMLTGCQSSNNNQSDDSKSVNNDVEYVHYLLTNDDNLYLQAYNLNNEKISYQNEISVEGVVVDSEVYEGGNQVAVLISSTTDAEQLQDGSIISDSSGKVYHELVYYNKVLEVEKNINVDEIFEDKNVSSSVKYQLNSDLTMLVAIDLNNVYLYDLENEKFVDIEDKFPNHTLIDIVFDENDQLCYLAYGDEENDYYVGYFNLDTMEYRETTIEYNTDGNIYFTDDYLYFNDLEEAYTRKSSGYILLVSKDNLEVEKISVNGLESTMSKISSDGNYIVGFTRNEEDSIEYNAVVYEKSSMKKLKEFTIEKDITLENIVIVNNSIYITPTTEDEEVMRVDF